MTVTSVQTRARAGVTYAVGVIRVSQQGKREAERFKSPSEQRDRIAAEIRRQGAELAQCFQEIDISGKLPLARRHGLRQAVEAIEAGHARVLVVAYFDRLVRNLRVQAEVVQRVEAAGGRVLALDFGEVTEKTAAQWLSSTLMGAVAEYYARSVGERLASTAAMAIASGVPVGALPPGYRRDPATRRVVLHEAEAAVMREAFAMRADGASWSAVRGFMAANGIVRSIGNTRTLLHSRTYLGELTLGDVVNPGSHTPLVDLETFERIGRQKGEAFKAAPGRKSELLLSGLRLLRCATCGHSLLASTQTTRFGKSFRLYRCNPGLVCSRRVAIDAALADQAVTDYVRELVANDAETEGPGMELIEARAAVDAAQAALDTAIRGYIAAGVLDEASAQQSLRELREKRDAAADRASDLERAARAVGDGITLNGSADWDALTLADRREIITAVLARVVVAPGGGKVRGASRLTFVTVRDELGGDALG